MTTLVAQDFTSFVFAQGDDIKTTSLLVAEKFGKLHKDVLRAVRNLHCSEEFNQRNFAPIDFIDKNSDSQPAYEMTKDGFMFLVMGFTGKAAAQIKEAYINAFNLMHAKLFPKVQAKPKTLNSAMLRHIQKRINWLVKHQCGTTYASLGGMLLDKFNVNERRAIPIEKYPEVCALLNCEPDPKALQGELVEPAKLEYQPPKGMVLISESELAQIKKRKVSTWSNYATMTLSLPDDNSRLLVSMCNGVTSLFEVPENYLIGNVESLTRQLKLEGYHLVKDDPQNKLETIEKIVTAKFVA